MDASLARLCARHVSLCEVYLHHPLPHASFGVWFVLFHQQKIENDMDNIEYALRVVDEEVGCFVFIRPRPDLIERIVISGIVG